MERIFNQADMDYVWNKGYDFGKETGRAVMKSQILDIISNLIYELMERNSANILDHSNALQFANIIWRKIKELET